MGTCCRTRMRPPSRPRLLHWRRLVVVAAVLFVLVQAVAWNHARHFMQYAASGDRTPTPETLGISGKLRILVGGVRFPRPANVRTPATLGLAFEEVSLRTRDGVSIRSWRLPAAPSTSPGAVVLLFHGYGGSRDGLLDAAALLNRHGHEAWATDFRGSGDSEGNRTSLGHHEAEDVRAVFEEARRRSPGRRVFLYGFSMGGAAALRATARLGVEPDGIVLEATFARFVDAIGNRFRAMGLPTEPGTTLLAFWAGRVAGFDGFAHRPVDDIGRVRVPILLIQGKRDARVRRDEAEALRTAAPGAELVLLEKAGHELGLASEPDAWREAVLGFLAKRSSTGK